MQYVNISLSSLSTTQASFTRDVLWLGPAVPSATKAEGNPTNVVMDLAFAQGVFLLGGVNSALYFQRLTFINPMVSSEAITGSGFGVSMSALPLWAIQFVR